MKHMKSLPYLLIIATLVVQFFGFVPTSAATPFNPNNLIDDFTFENTTSMSAAMIDAWLNVNFPNSCISSNANSNGNVGFVTPDPLGWSDAQNKYLYGGNVTAGKAIADTAALYHINPQVILTTLQKEQSIIGGGAGCHYGVPDPNAPFANPDVPTAGKTFTCTINNKSQTCTYACTYSGGCMNIALGYGCPYYCAAKNEGFSPQLTLGTWLFRFNQKRANGVLSGYPGYETGDQYFTYSGPMTAGYRQRVSGGPSVYYDGTYTTVDGTSVVIANGATASLYTFTPYISGNRSFDNIFQGALADGYLGFGSVYANDTFTAHPNGTLVSSGGKVFLINNGTKQWITNGDTFASYGYAWSQVKVGSIGDANLPTGANIDSLAPGTIFRSDNTPVYVMTYENGSLVKQQISYYAFTNLDYSWNDVLYVAPWRVPAATSPSILFASQHPAGTLVADRTAGKVYRLGQSTKDWIYSPAAFETNNFLWTKIKTASSLDIAIPNGPVIDIKQGTMVLSSGNIYLIDYDAGGALKRPVGPWECFSNRLHYTLSGDTFSLPIGVLPSRNGALFTC